MVGMTSTSSTGGPGFPPPPQPVGGRPYRRFPCLSADLPGPRHPDRCQQCGRAAADVPRLEIWEECDDDDRPGAGVYVLLCTDCNAGQSAPPLPATGALDLDLPTPPPPRRAPRQKTLIERHPRLYHGVEANTPFPGLVALCGGCRWRDGLYCRHPERRANGGAGTLKVEFKCGPRAFITGRGFRSQVFENYRPAHRCSGREPLEEADAVSPETLPPDEAAGIMETEKPL